MNSLRFAPLILACLMPRLAIAATATPVPVVAPAAKSEITPKVDASDLAALRAKAEHGNAIAQYNLGLAYFQGRQTAVDPIEAFMWLTLASEGGSTGKALGTVLSTLTTAQLAEGRKRLETFHANNAFLRNPAAKSSANVTMTPSANRAPVVAAVPSSDEAKHLYDQLAAETEQKRQLATELGTLRKENARLQSMVEAAPGKTASQATLAELQALLKDARANAAAATTALTQERSAHAETQAALLQARAQLDGINVGRDAAPCSPAVTPAASEPAHLTDREDFASARNHKVVMGETLASISRQYYGTPTRWPDIFAANRDILRDERTLPAGGTLRIP